MECLQYSKDELNEYYDTLNAAVAREVIELDKDVPFDSDDLHFMMRIFNKQMKAVLQKSGLKAPNFALQYWKH